jgi:gliding motility-associated-like protein
LDLFPNPNLNLGNDTILCLSEKPILDAGAGMLAYNWNNGNKSQKIVAYDSGLYIVEVTDFEGCKSRDSIWINKKKDLYSSDIFMPNAFTPNGDGVNDNFKPTYVGIQKLEYFRIYDRYGVLVFETSSIGKAWDGTYKNMKQNTGNFVYIVKGIDKNGKEKILKGNVVLIR